jgi:hemoglobin
MYPDQDFEAAEQRLADFLIYRFGGSQKYIEQRGHPRLRGRHMPFAVDVDARNRWMALMDEALEQVDFPSQVKAALAEFFGQTATFMMNR